MGHELGHILIPWHVGNFACKPSEYSGEWDSYFADLTYHQLESEANRFSAQFLLPDEIVINIIKDGGIEGVYKFSELCNISRLSTSFNILKLISSGYIFVKISDFGIVEYTGKSRGTMLEAPLKGSSLDLSYYLNLNAEIIDIDVYDGKIYWINTANICETKKSSQDKRKSSIILIDIYDEIGIDIKDRKFLSQSISGVIGAANSHAKKFPGTDLYTIFKIRLENKKHLKEITCHHKFDDFLQRRSIEIESRS